MHGLTKCPLESGINKEDCSAAGLSVGGSLENNELTEGSWDDKPSGCLLSGEKNVVQFNSNPVGAKGDNSTVLVCNNIEVRYNLILHQ